MTLQTELRNAPLPENMRALLAEYPRESWRAHPNFRQATKNWLGAHRMFRYLAALIHRRTKAYLDGDLEPNKFATDLSYYGDALVQNLHGHHNWEDRVYFPELARAEPRFKAGLEVLETDHLALNTLLDAFARKSNRVVKLIQLDAAQAKEEAAALPPICEKLEALLSRHLSDEEDLAVPIILHHKLRG